MGPVSFSRFQFDTRTEAMDAARALAKAGIRLQSVDRGTTLLVRGEDHDRAADVLRRLAPDDPSPARIDGAAPGKDDGRGREPNVSDSSGLPPGSRLIEPLDEPFDATVDLPGSKSHTNRALLCAALAAGTSTLSRVLLADDTEAMLRALGVLGVTIAVDRTGPVSANAIVDGTGPAGFRVDEPVSIDVRQSGTTGRFLLPALAAGAGRFRLDGHPQLRARPFGPQLDALRDLGACIEGTKLPLSISGRRLRGGRIAVSGDVSSQFLSGLMMAAPMFAAPTEIRLDGELVSRPYVDLTVHTMAAFGVDVESDPDRGLVRVPADPYLAAALELEPDASAASYFFAAAAVTGSRVRIEGLGRSTVQGDLRFVELLSRMGAHVTVAEDFTEVQGTGRLVGIRADLSDLSDTAQTLAVVAACADGPTEITGIGFIRHKETDRIAAPVTELRRLGVEARATDDGIVIQPGPIRPATVQTYDDHRMAMSFAVLGLRYPGIVIAEPGCVAKTFPNFFDVLDSLRAS